MLLKKTSVMEVCLMSPLEHADLLFIGWQTFHNFWLAAFIISIKGSFVCTFSQTGQHIPWLLKYLSGGNCCDGGGGEHTHRMSTWCFDSVEGNVSFNDTLNTFYFQLYGIRHRVKDHSVREETHCCHYMGYSVQLAARDL